MFQCVRPFNCIKKIIDTLLLKGTKIGYSLKRKTEGRLQKYVQQSLKVYYSVYTSLHVCNPPDLGKAVGKLLKHLMSTFIKESY